LIYRKDIDREVSKEEFVVINPEVDKEGQALLLQEEG
jgi:hypothetical protein